MDTVEKDTQAEGTSGAQKLMCSRPGVRGLARSALRAGEMRLGKSRFRSSRDSQVSVMTDFGFYSEMERH